MRFGQVILAGEHLRNQAVGVVKPLLSDRNLRPAQGRIQLLRILLRQLPEESISLREAPFAEEINRLEKALIQTRHEILEVQRKVSEGMGAHEGSIFDAHLLVLEDRTLLDEVMRVIQEEKVNAEYAFNVVAERYATTLAAIEDDYLRERATDMRDVTVRVLNNLLGVESEVDLRNLKEPCIVISHDLTPPSCAQGATE